MKLEIEVELPLAAPAELMRHVYWALEQYRTRSGQRFTEVRVANLGAFNYKYTGAPGKPS